ncbi:MAG: TetR/AcrR family transcriptional regulator [Leptospira sp.]|nr:TetR/AcrR family transcriptional regulator [Leptospira sp.]
MDVLDTESSVVTMNEKIVEVAKKLFAERGYQAVSTREIAEYLGINISTFHYHTGGKGNLYKSVIESVYKRELEVIHEPIFAFDDCDFGDRVKVRDALFKALDGFFDQMLTDPHRPHLYVRRWLEWPDEFMDQEVKNTLETFLPFKEFLDKAQSAGTIRNVNPSIFIRSFLWMVYGYFITGIIDWKSWVSEPFKKKNMSAFKDYIRDYVDSMLFREEKIQL